MDLNRTGTGRKLIQLISSAKLKNNKLWSKQQQKNTLDTQKNNHSQETRASAQSKFKP